MDFTNPNTSKAGASLTQNKIPSEMLASYRPQTDFAPVITDLPLFSFDQAATLVSPYSPYYQYQNSYYEPYVDANTPFSTKFPRAKNYNNDKSVHETFPHLETINNPEFDLESISSEAQFYVLRSGNDDNIHKAIKYHLWSTTTNGKDVLKKAWQDFENRGAVPEIYLIFSVVNSNQFLGVARMTSNINDEESFKFWWEPCKWFGTFQLQWLFIKDIQHFKFDHIREGSYPTIVNSRDNTPITAEAGKEVMKVFKEHAAKPNIFDSFEYMDRREDYIRAQRDHNPEFEGYFEECCTAYKEDPDRFQVQKKPYYPNKNGRKVTRPNYGYKKYSNNGNGYHGKTAYYKKNGGNWYNGQQQFEQHEPKVEGADTINFGEKEQRQPMKFRDQKERKYPNRFYKAKENQGNNVQYQDENQNFNNIQNSQ